MGWVQLGLFLEQHTPVVPKAKPKPKGKPKAKPRAKATPVSKSKPIPKSRPSKFIKLAPGELDDPLDF